MPRLLLSFLFFLCGLTTAFAQADVNPADAVVAITVSAQKPDGTGTVAIDKGTGFLIGADGWVVTAAHVIPTQIPAGDQLVIVGTTRDGRQFPLALQPGGKSDADVALLRFPSTLGIAFPYLCVDPHPNIGLQNKILGLGFPLGKQLSERPGAITSTADENGMIQANMGLAEGMSGGPVIDASDNAVIGVITGGWAMESSFDFFMPTNQALGVFQIPPAKFVGADCAAPPPPPPPKPHEITRDVQIDQTYDHHDTFDESSQDYTVTGEPDDGYRIVKAELIKQSATRDTDEAINIGPDGKSAVLTYKLTAGPAYDKYRGWLHATLHLTERLISQ